MSGCAHGVTSVVCTVVVNDLRKDFVTIVNLSDYKSDGNEISSSINFRTLLRMIGSYHPREEMSPDQTTIDRCMGNNEKMVQI